MSKKAIGSRLEKNILWPKVSEQFLNGTSAQYRLYSAIQIKSKEK